MTAAVAAYLTAHPPTVSRVASPTGQDVVRFLGKPLTAEDLVRLADIHVATIATFAAAYTRRNGFSQDAVEADIAGVIITATARLISHPEQIERTIGSVRQSQGWKGWSLQEQAVLNRYRKVAG